MATRVVAVVALLLAGCAGATADESATGEGLDVVVTTSVLGDVVEQLVGDDGTVQVLMSPGVDPHVFAPSAAQALELRQADLVVANGVGLEAGLLDTLASAEQDGVRVLWLGESMDPAPVGALGRAAAHDDHEDGHDADGEEHADDDERVVEDGTGEGHDEDGEEDHAAGGHDHDGLDPHVWLDPRRMVAGVEVLGRELAAVDAAVPDARWEQRTAAYVAELEELDGQIADVLATVPAQRRVLVTNHDAFGYFAERYDLTVVGTIVPGASTRAEASARDFADLVQLLRDEPVPAIFTESAASDRLVTALAGELGRDVAVVELHSGALGEPGSAAGTYAGMLREDARLVAEALAPSG